jgi:hypothetical protein
LGLVCGLLVHPGHYHVALVDLIGWENAHRIDFLPRYLAFRMNTDVIQDVQAPNRRQNQQQGKRAGDIFFSWAFFVGEMAGAVAVAVAYAWVRAGKAYCEECRKWMASTVVKFPSGTGADAANLYLTGRLSELEKLRPTDSKGAQGACDVTAEHCVAGSGKVPRCSPVYLKIKEPIATRRQSSGRVKRHAWIRQAELNEEEISALASVFPSLHSASESDKPSVGGTAEPVAFVTGPLATVHSIPSPYQGKVLSRGHLWFGVMLGLLPILTFPVALGLFAVAATLHDQMGPWIAAVVGISGFGSLLLGVLIFTWYADFLPSRYLHRLAKRELELRPDRWVHANNPDAVFIQVVPRENWGRLMLENATDVGFLRIDPNRREIVFEGDRQRYRIPAGSIVSCQIESFSPPGDAQQRTLFYLTVIRANTKGGLWETQVAHRHIGAGRSNNKTRLAGAEELKRQIDKMMAGGRDQDLRG